MPDADASRPTAETSRLPERAGFPTEKQIFGLLLIYFTVQIILRVAISSSLDLDESEQLVLTQKLSWGYGSQPPLYTWLQFFFFKAFGVSVFSLSLLKNILLFCTYRFTYLNARLITRNHACGVAAAASLLFIPQVAWESQRDLTHSVLAATLACVALFCFLRLREKKSVGGYVLFGLCAGFGILSKYNFALVLVALTLAAISLRQFRTIILDKRMAPTILIAALIILPNATWALEHRDLALRSAGKLKIEESGHWFRAFFSGLKSLSVCSATFFALLAVIYGIVFWKRRGQGSAPLENNEYSALLLRMLLFSYGVIVLAIILLHISDVRDRWLQPILICSPVLAVTWFQNRLNIARLRWLLALAGVVMIAVTAVLHGRILFAERSGRTQPWNRPFDALAQQLKGPVAPASTVLTDNTLLAGNLRLNIRDKIFTTPELARLFVETNGPVALAWDAGGDAAARKFTHNQTRDWPPPDNLADFAERAGLKLDPAQAQYFSATFKYHRTRQMKVAVVLPAPETPK